MKRAIFILILGGFVCASLPEASASIAPGSKCSKAGMKSVYKNKSYTCIKLGKNLYWDNGINLKDKAAADKAAADVCSSVARSVRAYFGAELYQGFLMSSYIFQNNSNCHLGIYATVTFVCPEGGVLRLDKYVRSSGAFALGPYEKLVVNGLNYNRFFPVANQQCLTLTGFKTNSAQLTNQTGYPPVISITSSNP